MNRESSSSETLPCPESSCPDSSWTEETGTSSDQTSKSDPRAPKSVSVDAKKIQQSRELIGGENTLHPAPARELANRAGVIREFDLEPLPVDAIPLNLQPIALHCSTSLDATKGRDDKGCDELLPLGVPNSGDVSSESASAEASYDGGELWRVAQERLQNCVADHIFDAYLAPLQYRSVSDDRTLLVLTAASPFIRNHVERNLAPTIAEVLGELLGHSVKISIEIGEDSSTSGRRSGPSAPIVVKRIPVARGHDNSSRDGSTRENGSRPGERSFERFESSGLNPRYTFSNFVVGNNNQFCHAAAMRVAERPGYSYNPLFIYGGVGLGKTHILHAIGNAVLEQDPTARVIYMSSETFTNELIQALRNAKMEEFKRKMRTIRVLLIDDIQFMCGKERTQEEFFHTFNTLYNAKHQIVLTSDKIPQEIPGIEERLQTRFSWGLTADLQAPDFETRVAILRRKATIEGYSLPSDVAQVIASKFSSNVRELEGALTRIHAVSSLQNVPLSVEVAQSALRPILQPKPMSISVDDIKRVVAAKFGIKVSEIVSKRRTKNLSFPRHIAMYLCRKHTTCSYPEIGGHFGNRDHSSVIHAANVVTTKLTNDAGLRDLISNIERELLAL